MSLNNALLTGVSGLVANSSALAATSQNIANVDTVGYKGDSADFQTLVNSVSQYGGYDAGGVIEQTQQLITQTGTATQTNSPTDLSISGQGFFVVTNQAVPTSTTTPTLFTRAGSFTTDSQGYLKNSAGLYLQGWPVNPDGSVTTDPSNLSKMQSINVNAVGGAAEPTTAISISANLNSSQAVSDAVTNSTYDPTSATASMAAYDPTTGAGTKPDYSVQIPISDSKGGEHTIQLDFLKSSTPNQWYVEAVAVPASDIVNASGVPGQIAAGTLAFTSSGQLDPSNTSFLNISSTGVATLALGASSAAAPSGSGVNWASGLGISAQTINFTLGSANSGLTQDNSTSATQSITTNGTPFGNLSSIQINPQGVVTAVFDNGVSREIAQLGLATFPNADGLTPTNGNAYQVSQASGTYNLKVPGTGGAGLLDPSTLESSTVDLSSEFANLITYQQAYSASSKIVTTADQMMQELINIIQ
jgi:flagellar hook protein FlgE